jgi:hypothetical protein
MMMFLVSSSLWKSHCSRTTLQAVRIQYHRENLATINEFIEEAAILRFCNDAKKEFEWPDTVEDSAGCAFLSTNDDDDDMDDADNEK